MGLLDAANAELNEMKKRWAENGEDRMKLEGMANKLDENVTNLKVRGC